MKKMTNLDLMQIACSVGIVMIILFLLFYSRDDWGWLLNYGLDGIEKTEAMM